MSVQCVVYEYTYTHPREMRWGWDPPQSSSRPPPLLSHGCLSLSLISFLLFFSFSFFSLRKTLSVSSSMVFLLVFLHFGGLKGQISQSVQHEDCRARRDLYMGTFKITIRDSWLFRGVYPNPLWLGFGLGQVVELSGDFLMVLLEFYSELYLVVWFCQIH